MTATLRSVVALSLLTAAITVLGASAGKNLRLEMGSPSGANAYAPDPQKQRDLIATIQSPTTPASQKAIACKQLAIHGTDEAVPVLLPLLSDPHMASWARIALEAIPGRTVDNALREAMNRLDGNLLIGVINSIGERHDSKAVGVLSAKLKGRDASVVSASAVALGKIGGSSAARALQAALKKASPETSAAIAEGCIRSAEQFLAENKQSQARKLYDAVRVAKVPRNKMLEATRGAILARGDAGIPMLLDELRSPDKDRLSIGLRTARELPGRKATEAVAAEVRRSPQARQPYVLLALADRHDPAALPTVVDAAKTGAKPVQMVAVAVLERLGSLSSLPVLVEVAKNTDRDLSQAAVGALIRLPAEGVDREVVSRLAKASGREREVLIRVASQRQIQEALAPILSSTQSSDAAVRKAALQALGSLGSEKQVPALLELLTTAKQQTAERGQIEDALFAISARCPAAVSSIAPLARNDDPELRSVALRCLSASGGPEALKIVQNAVEDSDPGLQNEAVAVLVAWPNTWPEDSAVAQPLLTLAQSAPKKSHQLLALRGYLQYVQGDTKLKPEEKVSKVREISSLMQRPEEKRIAISVLGEVNSPAAVDQLVAMIDDETVREDTCSALLKLGSRNVAGLPKPIREKALRTVLERSQNENLRKRAEERLRTVQ